MSTLYERIVELCSSRGITGYKLCKDTGLTPSVVTDLKMGRKQGLSAKNADKIAKYFGVSVGYLLGDEPELQKEKAPAPYEEDTRSVEEILEQAKNQLMNQEGLMFDGGVASEKAIESILAAMKIGLEMAKNTTREEREEAARLKAEILAKAEAMDDE